MNETDESQARSSNTESVTTETPQACPEPPSAASEPSGKPLDISAVQADLEKFRELAMRAQADFDNYRKRVARERDEAVRYANTALLEALLPVIDNFELGLDAARGQDPGSVIFQGMAMVQKQLGDFLTSQNVTPIDVAPGSSFDPKQHEAIGHEPHDTIAEGCVIRQLRRGYVLRDRLLRPATVFVSSGKAT
jgi:molecular chaperone GrpE